MKVTLIGWIWIIFILIFIMLSLFHFIKAGKKVSKFEVGKRPMNGNVTIKIAGSELDQPLRDFITDFNSYIDSYNNSTSLQNIIAAFGYMAAALIALLSLFIELKIIK